MPDLDGAIIDRMYAALSAGDLDPALACLAPHVRIWHCFDRVVQDRAAIQEGWRALIANYSERAFVDIRRHPIAGGFVQQLMMTGRTASGKIIAWPICMMVQVENGMIARIDEYIDRAGSFEVTDLHVAATPGLWGGP